MVPSSPALLPRERVGVRGPAGQERQAGGCCAMIETLEINNFKSVKALTLPCRRFNVFIGEPNTGKSNILEALGLLSFVSARQYAPGIALDGFVRHKRTSNLFYDEDVGNPLSVRCDKLTLELGYREGLYRGSYAVSSAESTASTNLEIFGDNRTITGITPSVPDGEIIAPLPVRAYRSPAIDDFSESAGDFLLPPYGENLLSLLVKDRALGKVISAPFAAQGFRLWLRPHENKIDLVKDSDDIVAISYPYSLTSETLQRLTFYTAAILTNRNAALVFEEPETHSFPYHTKHLAELVALDGNCNQYFIATHNPYFLMPLLDKAPLEQVAINLVYYEDYQTKVKTLPPEDLPGVFELDIFLNLERYLEP